MQQMTHNEPLFSKSHALAVSLKPIPIIHRRVGNVLPILHVFQLDRTIQELDGVGLRKACMPTDDTRVLNQFRFSSSIQPFPVASGCTCTLTFPEVILPIETLSTDHIKSHLAAIGHAQFVLGTGDSHTRQPDQNLSTSQWEFRGSPHHSDRIFASQLYLSETEMR